jgi:hypothetical protein
MGAMGAMGATDALLQLYGASRKYKVGSWKCCIFTSLARELRRFGASAGNKHCSDSIFRFLSYSGLRTGIFFKARSLDEAILYEPLALSTPNENAGIPEPSLPQPPWLTSFPGGLSY